MPVPKEDNPPIDKVLSADKSPPPAKGEVVEICLAVVKRVPVVGKVILVAPVDVKVMELAPEVAKVEPSTKVNVAPVAGAVIVILFIDVAVATPKVGVVKVGEVAKTMLPEPVVVLPKTVTVPLKSGKV